MHRAACAGTAAVRHVAGRGPGGAEQGDPEGSYKSSAVLAGVCQRTAQALAATRQGLSAIAAVDWWYIDDGRLVVRADQLDDWLVAFDQELARVGGTRVAADGAVKSTARLLGGYDATYSVMPLLAVSGMALTRWRCVCACGC